MITDEKARSSLNLFNPTVVLGTALPIGQATAQHIEVTKAAQDAALQGSQQVFERWFARRRESAEALAVLGHDVLQAKSPQDLVQLWVQWSKGAVDRLLDDAKDQMTVGASVARIVESSSAAVSSNWAPRGEAAELPSMESASIDRPASKDISRH